MPSKRSATTRKLKRRRQNGGIFGFGKPTVSEPQAAAFEAAAARNAALARSKARVANYLAEPGSFTYTNKNRIQNEYKERIDLIKAEYGITDEDLTVGIEEAETTTPKQISETIKDLKYRIENELATHGPTAAAITLTIPVGVAQLALKAFRVWLAFVVFVFAVMPIGLIGADISPLASRLLPNSNFKTTKNSFSFLKRAFKTPPQ